MLSEADQQRARFCEGDTVAFFFRNQSKEGQLIRMNPKRAIVRLNDSDVAIPYERLQPKSGSPEQRIRQLQEKQDWALLHMRQHGLNKWSFQFDHSSRRAGCCNYRTRRISIAFDLARTGTDVEIHDTILHEIAHALVGKKHNHDAIWKAKAREIGCSGKRTHSYQFAQPRWAVSCVNHCWEQTAQKRNPRLICRTCGGKLIYTPFSAPS